MDVTWAGLFTVLTFVSSIMLAMDIVDILSEGILQGIDFGEVTQTLMQLPGVTSVRNLRIWALTMNRVSMSVVLGVRESWQICARNIFRPQVQHGCGDGACIRFAHCQIRRVRVSRRHGAR